jgi:predicted membrane-bound spermidine synthase
MYKASVIRQSAEKDGLVMKSKKHSLNKQVDKKMGQGRDAVYLRWGLLIPNCIVFVSSLCIMVLELTAGRLIARHVGFSLYTWTSVIGVVLGGIAVGNFFGGRLADRYQPRRTLAILFLLAAVSCAVVPILNQEFGIRLNFVMLFWPLKIFFHVLAVFFIPSMFLGMISPVVVKWALGQGERTGRTLGDVYAWGVVGSITGTFLAGFLLIPMLGTLTIMGCIAVILAGLGVLFLIKGRVLYGVTVGLILLITVVSASQGWVFGIKQSSHSRVLFEKESQYSYIKVESNSEESELRTLTLDGLQQSFVNMREPTDMSSPHQYDYIKLYAILTHQVGGRKERLRTFFMGGGGYVMPRYVEKFWPGSHIEVSEIDPEVTETAIQMLGLSRKHSMQIVHLDVRNHVDDLLLQRKQGEVAGKFDVIYGDAFNPLGAPFQLTTLEFNEKIRILLAADGVYILNINDNISTARFLSAEWNTLRQTFPYVTVFSKVKRKSDQGNLAMFVLLSSLHPLQFEKTELAKANFQQFDDLQLKQLEECASGIVLRDDYAPVESFLGPVIQERQKLINAHAVGNMLINEGLQLVRQGRVNEAIACYRGAIKIGPMLGPMLAEGAHYNIAELLVRKGKLDGAMVEYREVLRLNPDDAEVHDALASLLIKQSKFDEAKHHNNEAQRINPNILKDRVDRRQFLRQRQPTL